VIRTATANDAPILWELLRELADYERLTDMVTGDSARLAAHLSGEAWPRIEGLVAEVDGHAVGYALYFGEFSSFATTPTLWLEDLYVRESHRGSGLGHALMSALAREALARGCLRMEWAVLDWNEPALAFYRRLGAGAQTGWSIHGLEGAPLGALAAGSGVRSKGPKERPTHLK
jgi:GNAT superfamily N-acetyltransferase